MVYKGIRRYTKVYKKGIRRYTKVYKKGIRRYTKVSKKGSELCHYLVEITRFHRRNAFTCDVHFYAITDEFPIANHEYLLRVWLAVEGELDANFIVAVDIPPYFDAPVV